MTLFGPNPNLGRGNMAFTFRLYLENGEDVGTFATAAPDWRVGDEFRSGIARYRIENIVVDEDVPGDEFQGVFVVSPIEVGAS